MTLRVLVIDDQADFRRLLALHVATGFDEPAVAEYDPAAQGRLPPDFQAAGYDVVLLDEEPGAGTGLTWLKDLRRRPGFPPIVYLLTSDREEAVEQARAAGAFACLPKAKIDHARLIATLRDAQLACHRAQEPIGGTDESDQACRFGDLVIRGHRFVKKLAETTVSTVYLADSIKIGQPVVLKVLKQVPDPGGAAIDNFDRFLREYEIASTLRHPNIVRIFDVGAGDDHAYIAMEYFPADDLRERIRQGLTPLEAITIARQMTEALKVLHDAGVLHRDLKPGNIMLREDGSPVLIDFGMSKQRDLSADITSVGQIFGTPYYMSPEQGHGRELDARSDLYSLGIILFEMLMRRKPYVAGTPMKVIFMQANAPLPELAAELKRFEPIVHRCIEKIPARRYASADKLLDVLREMEKDEAERLTAGF